MRIARSCIGILLGFLSTTADAAVIHTSSCSSTDVQSAINAASSGDTVLLAGPCSATWNVTVTIPATKGIVLDGNGATTERGTGIALGNGLIAHPFGAWLIVEAQGPFPDEASVLRAAERALKVSGEGLSGNVPEPLRGYLELDRYVVCAALSTLGAECGT